MSKINAKYNKSKSAKVGEECICPSCGAKFIKENYQQAFCKSKTGTKCKDKYWNTVTPQKRCNTTRISPASAAFMASEKGIDIINNKKFGMSAPNILGGSGKIQGITSEGYRIVDGTAYDEFDEPMYDVELIDLEQHPFDLEN
jgi:hypothetical protein